MKAEEKTVFTSKKHSLEDALTVKEAVIRKL